MMNAAKKIARSPGLLFLGMTLGFWSSDFLASYKVVLKDGRVIEARTKPVSMEGRYRFTDSNNQFQSISIQLVDVTATQSLNTTEEPKSTHARVLTNEDLAKQTAARPVNTVGNSPKPPEKNPGTAAGPKKGEAYWRSRAKQIRDEIEGVDKQIKALNEKTQAGKSDGIKIGFETYNSLIYAGFESQLKELERQKEKLQKEMTALEEEARQGGALPGWLR
jgi:DNA repair exonuclease SbcCD ATPase subunit